MTKLTLEQQELLFANDCKLINLRYEYHGYTGTEKWAIVTELAEEELWVKLIISIRFFIRFWIWRLMMIISETTLPIMC